MKKYTIFLLVLMVIVPASQQVQALIIDDGLEHTIDYYLNDWVVVHDGSTLPLPDVTTLNIETGATITQEVLAYDNSKITMSGGLIEADDTHFGILAAFDHSEINFSGGTVGHALQAYDNSQVIMTSGSVVHGVTASHNSQMSIFGGSLGVLIATADSQITIHGTDFNYPYGPLLSPSRLNGTLANGDPIVDLGCWIFPGGTASIILTSNPEPATILLLGLGGVIVGRRRG